MFEEIVEMSFTPQQNNSLERSFMAFYKLGSSPKIRRKLMVEKEEYKRFIKSKTRARTKFEVKESQIDLSFEAFRPEFAFVATLTEFVLPSGATYLVDEVLDGPNGKTQTVKIAQNIEDTTTIHNFNTYFEAEQFILEKFLNDKDILGESIGNFN